MSTVSNGPLFRSMGTGNPGTQRAGAPCPRLTLSARWNLTPIHSRVKNFFPTCVRVDKGQVPRPCVGRPCRQSPPGLYRRRRRVGASGWSQFAYNVVTTVANWCRTEERAVEAQLVEEPAERGSERALRPVLDLEREREPVRRGGAEKRLGPALRDPARERLHEVRVHGSRAADQLGVRTHRAGDTPVDAAERGCDPRQRQREGDDAAAVDRRVDLVGAGEARDLREPRLLAWMVGQAIALGRPALGPAQREHPGVLARAVVLQLRALEGPALEVVLGRGRLREERAHGLELVLVGQM